MAKKLTDKLVRELEPPARGQRIVFDTELAGFAVRVTAGGTKTFVLDYRVENEDGKLEHRRKRVSRYPDLSVLDARREAKQRWKDIKKGIDPWGGDRKSSTDPTMNALCDRYITDHLPKKRPSSSREDMSLINQWIRPELGTLKIADVSYAQIDRLHRKVSEQRPYRANRLAALLSKMFALAVKWELRTDNPAKGIERNQEEQRERYLSGAEIDRLMASLDSHEDQVQSNVIRLLLLTGARRGEVLRATWDQFDMETGVWVKPSANTKQKKLHRVPLSASVIAILTEIKQGSESKFVFPGPTPDEPLTSITRKFWREVCKAAEIESVRVHDLRHSYASILVNAGHSLPFIGALLGHSQPTTTARYAHLYDDPLRAAAEAVAQVVAPKGDSGEVIKLSGT